MIRITRLLFISLFLIQLGACSTEKKIKGDPQFVAEPDKVSLMLAQAADKAANALETLASVEQSKAPDISVAPIDNAPPALKRPMTVSWTGPVEPITRKIADHGSYFFRTIGTPPPVPLVVSVNTENQPIIDILRSIGLQLGVRADIRVDAQKQLVEIHYAPNTGIGGS